METSTCCASKDLKGESTGGNGPEFLNSAMINHINDLVLLNILLSWEEMPQPTFLNSKWNLL